MIIDELVCFFSSAVLSRSLDILRMNGSAFVCVHKKLYCSYSSSASPAAEVTRCPASRGASGAFEECNCTPVLMSVGRGLQTWRFVAQMCVTRGGSAGYFGRSCFESNV